MDTVIIKKIEEQYTSARQLFFHEENYSKPIEPEQIQRLFDFLEQSLKQPCNRLMYLESMFCSSSQQLIHKMYPFAYLEEIAVKQLQSYCLQAVRLAECYNILFEDEEVLLAEAHEL